jgi:hypothetical protein
VNFGSNNPFRNRTSSSPSLVAPDKTSPRPLSTNPFLDDFEEAASAAAPSGQMSSPVKSPADKELTGHTAELFVCDLDQFPYFKRAWEADVLLLTTGEPLTRPTKTFISSATTCPTARECPSR